MTSPIMKPSPAVAQNSQGTATPSPCGIALIISNRFLHTDDPFASAKKDEDALEKLWKDLHFDTRVLRDQTAEEMRGQLRSLAKLEGYRPDVKCVVVYILSHGSEGTVKGNNLVAVRIDELVQLFHKNNVHQSLASKPKIFFIDACRGKKADRGAAVAGLSASSPADSQDSLPDDDSQVSPTDSQDSLPDGVLICNATAWGFNAWHIIGVGSRFTQSLVAVFRQYHEKEHVEQMFSRVICKMNDSDCAFQTPWKRGSLTVFLRCSCPRV